MASSKDDTHPPTTQQNPMMAIDDRATAAELRELFDMDADGTLDDTIPTCSGSWVRQSQDLWVFVDESGDKE